MTDLSYELTNETPPLWDGTLLYRVTETLPRVISQREMRTGDVVELTTPSHAKWLTQAEVTDVYDGDAYLRGFGWLMKDTSCYQIRLLERNGSNHSH